MTKSVATSNLCALAITPPSALWPQLQEIRRVHDKNAERWPPHINVAFPFMAPHAVAAAVELLRARLQSFPRFGVCFERCAWLAPPDKKKAASRVWHYLEPDAAARGRIAELTRVVYECCAPLGLGEPRALPPHLSVAQSTLKDASRLSQQLRADFEHLRPTATDDAYACAGAVGGDAAEPQEVGHEGKGEGGAIATTSGNAGGDGGGGGGGGGGSKHRGTRARKQQQQQQQQQRKPQACLLAFQVRALCVMARKSNGNGKVVARIPLMQPPPASAAAAGRGGRGRGSSSGQADRSTGLR